MLPIEMRALAERLVKTPFVKWTADDMKKAREMFSPETVMQLSEKAKKVKGLIR